MAVAWEGTTFIGLSYFNYDTTALHGHNAGAMTSSVFDGEEAIFQHMESPNNQTTSATEQNWYMDLVVKVDDGTFTGSARFGFVIVVGTSMNDLRNGVDDAIYAMKGTWSETPPPSPKPANRKKCSVRPFANCPKKSAWSLCSTI